MNRKKLSLDKLKVKSFVTSLERGMTNTVKGGDPLAGTGTDQTHNTDNQQCDTTGNCNLTEENCGNNTGNGPTLDLCGLSNLCLRHCSSVCGLW